MALALGTSGISRGYLGSDIVSRMFLGGIPVLSPGMSWAANAGTFGLSGGISLRHRSTPFMPGQFALGGQAAGVLVGRVLRGAAGAFTLSGQDADLRHVTATSPEPGRFDLTGQALGIRKSWLLSASGANFDFLGGSPIIAANRLIVAGQGGFTLAGQDAAMSIGTALNPVTKSYIGTTSGKIITGTSVSCGPAFAGRRVFVAMTGQLGSGTVTGVTIGGNPATIHAVAYGSWSQYGNAVTVLASADVASGTTTTVKVATTEALDRPWYFDSWAVGNLSSAAAIDKKEVAVLSVNSADMSLATVPDGVVFVAAGLLSGQPDISGATRDYRININTNYLRRLGGSALTTAAETRAMSVYQSSSTFLGPLVSASFR